jgi:hypothetical protein
MPVQVDGEPFELTGPAKLTIQLANKVNVMVKAQDGKTPIETKIIKVLEWAEENKTINLQQKKILLDQFLTNMN